MLSRSVVSFTFYLVSTLPYAVHKVVVLTRPVYLQNALCTQSLSHIRLFATLWTVAHQAPLSMGILKARIVE